MVDAVQKIMARKVLDDTGKGTKRWRSRRCPYKMSSPYDLQTSPLTKLLDCKLAKPERGSYYENVPFLLS